MTGIPVLPEPEPQVELKKVLLQSRKTKKPKKAKK